jgi:hypothetical protein
MDFIFIFTHLHENADSSATAPSILVCGQEGLHASDAGIESGA